MIVNVVYAKAGVGCTFQLCTEFLLNIFHRRPVRKNVAREGKKYPKLSTSEGTALLPLTGPNDSSSILHSASNGHQRYILILLEQINGLLIPRTGKHN